MIVRRVRPLSVAKIAAFLYALIGLVAGVLVSFVFTLQSIFGARIERPGGALLGLMLGGGALVVLPIFYSAIGFLFTLLMSALYNVAAGLVGGIEIEIDAAGPQEPHSANL